MHSTPLFRWPAGLIRAAFVFGVCGPALAVEPRTAAIRGIFAPFQTDQAALAPDGKHVAFEKREGDRLFLAIVDLTTNKMVELPLMSDLATPLSGMKEKVPTRITYLKWPTSDRVVACVQDEVLVAADADGRNFKRLLGAEELQQETRGLDRAEFGPNATFSIDATTGRVEATQSGRSVLYGPDGEPFDQGFKVPTITRAGGEGQFQATDVNGNTTAVRIGDTGDAVTVDLFDSGGQVGSAGLRPRVLDLLLNEPENILVEIRGAIGPGDDVEIKDNAKLHSTVLKLNVRSGKISSHFDEYFTTRILCDKQGFPRATLRQVGTHRTLRIAAKAGQSFVPFEKALEGTPVRGLQITPGGLLGERAMPLGFGYNPDIFYYATNMGRDTYAIRSVDVVKKQDTGFVLEHPSLDFVNAAEMLPEDVLVFDRHRRALVGARINSLKRETFWVDQQLAFLQRSMEEGSKGMNVEILEWDQERTKFLVRLSDESDPGAYYIYDAKQKRIQEFARRAPWLSPAVANASKAFVITSPDGVKLNGYLTLPRNVRVEPIPLLVYCHDGPWSRDMPGYDRGAQALATMGFAVLQVNYRGSAGFGRAHLTALREQGEKVALRDIIAAVNWVQERESVSKKRVAILGNGYGGYLALRALQEYPERFRCGVSINAPTNLQRWLEDSGTAYSFTGGVRESFFGRDSAALKAASPALNGKPIRGPLLIIHAQADQVVPERHARDLRRALTGGPSKPEYFELEGEGHARWLPGSYVRVFDKLEEFFTTNIYNYQVEVGDASVVK
ncbi:MAG TPA: alpha/beta fold hydrolase [Opitutaceae bacterium]|nr:alpha/beta fold hydrolase [Opitutaceae bacterium]